MKILINTGTSGDDTVQIVTDEGTISLTVEQARHLAATIAYVASAAKSGCSYEEAVEI
jgi:hypothetical protein